MDHLEEWDRINSDWHVRIPDDMPQGQDMIDIWNNNVRYWNTRMEKEIEFGVRSPMDYHPNCEHVTLGWKYCFGDACKKCHRTYINNSRRVVVTGELCEQGTCDICDKRRHLKRFNPLYMEEALADEAEKNATYDKMFLEQSL